MPKQMTVKEKIERAMKSNCIIDKDEAEAAIEFVRSLLEIDIEETEEHEPHATVSIDEMKIAVSRVSDLDILLEKF